MENLGNTFREIRISKGMTLSETSEGILSVPFLSKYERGNTDISTTNFFTLMDKLNTSFDEFNLLHSNVDRHSQNFFLKELAKCLINEDIYLLNILIDKEQIFFEVDKNIRHQHNTILLRQYINKFSKIPFDNNQIKKIVNYLLQVEDWGYYELSLYGNSLFCLPLKNIDFLSKIAYKKAVIFSNLSRNQNELSLILMNTIVTLLDAKELNSVQSIINLTDKNLLGSKNYYEINKLNFLKGILDIKKGKKEEGKSSCMKALDIMQHMGNEDSARAHYKYLLDNI